MPPPPPPPHTLLPTLGNARASPAPAPTSFNGQGAAAPWLRLLIRVPPACGLTPASPLGPVALPHLQVLKILDADSWVERYAWFGPITTSFSWIGGWAG